MGFQIEDGAGTGRKMKVDLNNRGKVVAVTEPKICYQSKHDKDSYVWVAATADLAAADTALLVANTSTTKNLHITKIYVYSDVASEATIHCPAYPTLAGTAVTGKNLNRTSSKAAEASAYADETGNTQGDIVHRMYTPELTTSQEGISWDFEGALVLGYHQCVAVDIVADAAAFACTIMGYFEDDTV